MAALADPSGLRRPGVPGLHRLPRPREPGGGSSGERRNGGGREAGGGVSTTRTPKPAIPQSAIRALYALYGSGFAAREPLTRPLTCRDRGGRSSCICAYLEGNIPGVMYLLGDGVAGFFDRHVHNGSAGYEDLFRNLVGRSSFHSNRHVFVLVFFCVFARRFPIVLRPPSLPRKQPRDGWGVLSFFPLAPVISPLSPSGSSLRRGRTRGTSCCGSCCWRTSWGWCCRAWPRGSV